MLTVLSISNFIKPEIRKSADAFGMGWAYAPTVVLLNLAEHLVEAQSTKLAQIWSINVSKL